MIMCVPYLGKPLQNYNEERKETLSASGLFSWLPGCLCVRICITTSGFMFRIRWTINRSRRLVILLGIVCLSNIYFWNVPGFSLLHFLLEKKVIWFSWLHPMTCKHQILSKYSSLAEVPFYIGWATKTWLGLVSFI